MLAGQWRPQVHLFKDSTPAPAHRAPGLGTAGLIS